MFDGAALKTAPQPPQRPVQPPWIASRGKWTRMGFWPHRSAHGGPRVHARRIS